MIGMGAVKKRQSWSRGRVLVAKGLSLLAFLFVFVAGGCAAGKSEPLAPLPPLSADPSPGGDEISPEYRLLPGDIVRVKFLYQPELDVKLPVRPDGTIDVHEFGVMRVAGRTPEQVAREIERVSGERLRDPVVNVIIADLGQHKVYVGGEVRNPGFVYFHEGMTPLQAILDRGGFTDVARTDSVLKVSGTEATRLDLSNTVIKGSPETSTLVANDVVYVPRTFIGDANTFVRLYFRNMLPVVPRVGVGFAP